MKVGILTYHWEDNYGAVLQAYATARAIASLGHDPEFIDLRLPYNPSLVQRIVFALKKFRFNQFRKSYYPALSPKTYRKLDELHSDPPEYDCYLVGSDQTWNPNIASELLPAFFLTFGPNSVKRVTYATSIGQNNWEGSNYITDEEITDALGRFEKVLLREDSAVQICQENFSREATQVIDPVLLFPSYTELTGPLAPSDEIIAYKLIDEEAFYKMAKSIADSLNKPIRSIGSVRHPKGFRSSYPESPVEWVKRFANASIVMTDSFHGTVFSLLYHKPFVVYVGDPTRTTRIESLLRQVGLSDRLLTSANTEEDFKRIITCEIDWKDVDQKLACLRTDSMSLLKSALS